jgi:AAA15 family ATPase/GTPase
MKSRLQRIEIRNFKAFREFSFDLAGPNNCGKSTLLQAVMVWNLAMQRWIETK